VNKLGLFKKEKEEPYEIGEGAEIRVELDDARDPNRKILIAVEGGTMKLWIRSDRVIMGAKILLAELEQVLGVLTAELEGTETAQEK